jgi:drug/metabolite transporter (DMT)-like permease
MKLRQRTERQKGLIAIIALTIVYGLLPLFPRYLSASFDLFQQIYLRMFVGFIILLVIFHKQINFQKLFKLPFAEIRWVFFRAFSYYVLGVGLYTVAILMTKVSNVVFIGSIPITAILGFWWLGEKVTWQKVSLLILSALGVYIIAVKDFAGVPEFGLGELCALISSIFIALGLVMRKKQSSHLNDYETSTLMLLFAGAQLFVISLLAGEQLPFTGWNVGIIGVLLASGLTVAALSYLMNYGFARVPAVLAGNIITSSNFVAILTAFIAFGEVPILREFFGGLLIVISVLLMHITQDTSQKE